MTPLLTVRNLNIWFGHSATGRQVVRDFNLSMKIEKVGIVGESGSGKSITVRTLLGLLPSGASYSADEISFAGSDVTSIDATARSGFLGRRASLVLQEPRYALNPAMTIGSQIAEVFAFHKKLPWREAHDRAITALEQVRIREPRYVAGLYPHEVSGGMGQRAMIAMMLAPDPQLLIADEPTSALDASVEASVLETLQEQVTLRGMGVILISHDLHLVQRFCDRVIVMYQGRIMEACSASDLLRARHPYTRGLLNCVPRLGQRRRPLPVLQRDARWAH